MARKKTIKKGRAGKPLAGRARRKASAAHARKKASAKTTPANWGRKAARGRRKAGSKKRPIEQYQHEDKKRPNNPPVGLVTPRTDRDGGRKKYAFDPHLDPTLQWAGKAERTSFEVPTISLHVHERIDPKTIIQAVRRKNGAQQEPSLFDGLEENPPLREALDFYKHPHGWKNRLIAGDSLLVMNSLLEKEGLGGKVQCIYLDPPYGIKYGSNFQPFVNKRDVKDGKDEDLTAEPEMIRAFRDTWELGIHSYLSYLRDRLLLARELLTESGSVFVQISDENVHLVRNLMDEVFGTSNFAAIVSFSKAAGGLRAANRVGVTMDYLIWYFKNGTDPKYRPLFETKLDPIESGFNLLELRDGARRPMTKDEKQKNEPLLAGSRPYSTVLMTKPGPGAKFTVEYNGKKYDSGSRWWGTTPEGIQKVIEADRVAATDRALRMITYFEDFPYRALSNLWSGLGGAANPIYVVQTNPEVIKRCILMTTDPGDLVFDPTCGSGTTAYVAEQWGRRWITCDTSRVAVTLAKQRLMTAVYDYYELAHPHEGVASGFNYKTVPHVTLKSIANNPEIKPGMSREEIDAAIARHAPRETLYDRPQVDRKRTRVSGPFTMEAVPAPAVRPIVEVTGERLIEMDGKPALPGMEDPSGKNVLGFTADVTVARSGPTLRHTEWRDELLKSGVRGEKGRKIEFTRVEPLAGLRWLHAEAETKANGATRQRVVISFGPEHAPLEQKQVELAWEEARSLSPKPRMILFASFQFDPEAAKDIDELTPEKTGMRFLKAQMNPDLLTGDLRKKRIGNESFWLIGQPDVEVRAIKSGSEKGKYRVEVRGFDYFNPRTGQIESGDTTKVAMWMLDTDYDGRSLFARQVFFPMAGPKDGWARLARNLKAEIDEELIEHYRGTKSLPFEIGPHKRVAVKIVDDRGIESLKIVGVG